MKSNVCKLNKKKEYERVFVGQCKAANKHYIILYIENNLHSPRLGMAISKRNIVKATRRNKIKRVIRESFRLSKLPNFDFVVLANKSLKTASDILIRNSLDELWEYISSQQNKATHCG